MMSQQLTQLKTLRAESQLIFSAINSSHATVAQSRNPNTEAYISSIDISSLATAWNVKTAKRLKKHYNHALEKVVEENRYTMYP